MIRPRRSPARWSGTFAEAMFQQRSPLEQHSRVRFYSRVSWLFPETMPPCAVILGVSGFAGPFSMGCSHALKKSLTFPAVFPSDTGAVGLAHLLRGAGVYVTRTVFLRPVDPGPSHRLAFLDAQTAVVDPGQKEAGHKRTTELGGTWRSLAAASRAMRGTGFPALQECSVQTKASSWLGAQWCITREAAQTQSDNRRTQLRTPTSLLRALTTGRPRAA